jgi:hypothetical protein
MTSQATATSGSTHRVLTNAIFEWLEAFYDPTRQSALGYLFPDRGIGPS